MFDNTPHNSSGNSQHFLRSIRGRNIVANRQKLTDDFIGNCNLMQFAGSVKKNRMADQRNCIDFHKWEKPAPPAAPLGILRPDNEIIISQSFVPLSSFPRMTIIDRRVRLYRNGQNDASLHRDI